MQPFFVLSTKSDGSNKIATNESLMEHDQIEMKRR